MGAESVPEGRWAKISSAAAVVAAAAAIAGVFVAWLALPSGIREIGPPKAVIEKQHDTPLTLHPNEPAVRPSDEPRPNASTHNPPREKEPVSVPQALVMEYEELNNLFDGIEQSLHNRFRDLNGTDPKPEIISALSSCRQDLNAAKTAITAANVDVLRIRLDSARKTITKLRSL